MPSTLIIGASRGLGLEFVRQCVASGDVVWATARQESDLDRLRPMAARALLLDVTQDDAALVLRAAIDAQRFDTAVLCAGVGDALDAPQSPTRERFDAVMRANLLGPMQLLSAVAQRLVPGGRLAVLSSRMGSIAERRESTCWLYRASKAALNSVVKDAALAYGERITCVSLHPGWVRTDMGGPAADLSATESVTGLRHVIARLTPADTGRFFDHAGEVIPW